MSGFRINTNVPALFAKRQADVTTRGISQSLERLSSGSRINRAADDAAGLAISERFRSQANGINQAIKNLQDGISLLQVAEGGLSTVGDLVQRIRQLAVQAANDTLTDNDRALIQKEVDQLLTEVDRQASTVSFNGKILLDGRYSGIGTPGTPTTQTFDSLGVVAADARPNYYEDPVLVSPNLVPPEPPATPEFTGANYLQASTPGGGSFSATTNIAGNREAMRLQYNPGANANEVTALSFRYIGGSEVNGLADTLEVQIYDARNNAWVTIGTNTGTLLAFQDTTFAATGDLSRFVDVDGDIWAQVFTQTATTGGANVSEVLIDYASLTVQTTPTTSNSGLEIQAGANKGETIEVFLPDARRSALGLTGLSVGTRTAAENAITTASSALTKINGARAEIGAVQNRLENSLRFAAVQAENQSSAESRIRDLDFADEIIEFTKRQIIQQAGVSALAQANVAPQGVLQLLQ